MTFCPVLLRGGLVVLLSREQSPRARSDLGCEEYTNCPAGGCSTVVNPQSRQAGDEYLVSLIGHSRLDKRRSRSLISVAYNSMVRLATSSRRPKTTRPQRVIERLERDLAALPKQERPRDTLRARAEAVLSTLAGVDCAILIANNWGRYVHVNERAIRLTGYTEAELRRSSVWDLTPGVRLTAARRMWRQFLRVGRMQGPYVIQRKTGRSISVHYVAIAHVLPGLHVSALLRTQSHAGSVSRGRRPRTQSHVVTRRRS